MTVLLPDVSKTLEQLDGQEWGEPEWQSHLVQECHRLRRVPLREFTLADLRIMIGQGIGLEYLAPLALHALTDDPLLDAELYAGDLLSALLQSAAVFWSAHPELRAALGSVVESARVRLDALTESERSTAKETLCDAISRFQRSA
jgi:hypothetical protein